MNNGGKFCGETSNKIAPIIGARQTMPAGKIRYQNGMGKRIHQILDHMMEQIMVGDPNILEWVVLLWAVNGTHTKIYPG